jgi:hypothetical protein
VCVCVCMSSLGEKRSYDSLKERLREAIRVD